MRFYVISDLHLNADSNQTKAKQTLADFCKKIRTQDSPQEQIIFIFLGDITNKGTLDGFDIARNFLIFIRLQLQEYDVHFEFVPGNHDSLGQDIKFFDEFIANFGVNHSYENSGAYSKTYDGINFIFADSIRHRIHNEPGELDFESIEQNIKLGMQNILFCHHAFMQGHGGSHDTVYDAAASLTKLNSLPIDFVFHGHTHRADSTAENSKIVEIGCGSMFSQDPWMKDAEIQNQFTVGSTRDGRIIDVTRYIISRDGSDIFTYSTLYPKQKTFIEPEIKDKQNYEDVPYIPRKVFLHSYALEDPITQFFSRGKGCSLYDALITKQHVLLLSDAGMGKSVEFRHLAHQLYNSPFFPFFYSLRDYTNDKIEELLPPAYKQIIPHRLALLFDGYDELPDNDKRTFEARLNSYLLDNPQAYVVISSRRNFCRIYKRDKSHTLPSFTAYDLWKLNNDDVEAYLISEGINKTDFILKTRKENISDLLFNPFYLIELCSLYKSKGTVPRKTVLMKELIRESFNFDEMKFSHELEDRYRDFHILLRKLSFSMQLMGRSSLDDRSEYQELLECKNDRDLIKHCGLLQLIGSSWSFSHNNFREYLAAEYLSTLSEEQVKHFVASENGLKTSWINTLGFLTGMDLSWDLAGWLATFCPEALVKCEPDKIDSKLRYDIFEKIFLNHEQEGLWFDNEYCTEAELATFAQSSKTLTFLLDRIANPVHIQSKHAALKVLRSFSSGLYGRRKDVLDCLLSQCNKFPNIDGDTCGIVIIAIAQLRLNSPEITEMLVSMFSECDNDFVRLGMYEYLIETGEQDQYVGFFLDGIKYSGDLFGESNRIYNEHYMLEYGLKTMSHPESIISILRWCGNENNKNAPLDKKILSVVLETAAELFLSGEAQIFAEVFNCFLSSYEWHDFEYTRIFVAFFKATGTSDLAAIMAADNVDLHDNCLSYLIIVQPDTMNYILDAYREEKYNNHDKFKIIAERYANNLIYSECIDVIKKRTGVSMPVRPPKADHEALITQGRQEFFDAMFSKEATATLISLMLEKIGKVDVKIGELLDFHTSFAEHNSAWNILKIALYHNAKREWFVSEFMERVDFDRFSIIQIDHKIKSYKSLILKPYQTLQIEKMVINWLESGILKREIYHYDSYSMTSDFCHSLISLTYRFNFRPSETVLLDMTEAPCYCFGEEQGESNKYDYLSRHISESKLKKRLAENINSGKMGNNLLRDHIQICSKLKYEVAVDAALSVCTSLCDDTLLRNVAFNYLYSLHGSEYVEHTILPSADATFLLEISNVCKDISNYELSSAMEREFIKIPSLALMEALILRGSIMALEQYVSSVESNFHPPEYPEETGSDPTRAISVIADPNVLPQLERLMDVVFSPEFVDNSFFSLKSSLQEAFINCGVNAPERTLEILENHSKKAANDNNKRFCTYAAKEIKRRRKNLSDKPLSIMEVKRIIS